tara:strand:- start:1230 stop:1496 length:267 start_codon:yes stop_codon:yes gene_type:complete
MTDKTELERLQKEVENAEAAKDAAYKAWKDAWDTDAADASHVALVAWFQARDVLNEYLKEQQGNAANAAYDTLRKSVLGRDYKLERDK